MKKIQAYRILKTLEETNAAIIYKVQDRSEDHHVLKIARDSAAEHNDMIIREFQILNRVKHPAIVRVERLDKDKDGRAFFLQPFLPGKAIDTCFSSFSPDLADALLDIVNALAVLHNLGFIHGDLKPEHILHDAATKKTVLIDFGYTRVPDDPGIRTGTIGFIAPEVIKGIGLDQRSDIFSLGAIMYMILTSSPISIPWQDIPEVPDAINVLVRRMCAREPAVRPLIAEIHEVLLPYATHRQGSPRYDVGLPPTTFVERPSLIEKLKMPLGIPHAICGDTGSGKTRLLLEVKYRFMQQGYHVLYHLVGGQTSLTGSLISFLDIERKMPVDESGRYAVFQDILSALQQHAARTPLVLLVDGIEAMRNFDRALLRYVGFGVKETPAAVVCTTTDPRIARMTGFKTLMLDPFTIDETEQMLTHTLCPLAFDGGKETALKDLTQWLQDHSGGNPSYLVELLSTLLMQDILRFSEHTWRIDGTRLGQISIPDHLENLAIRRYEHLGKDEQTVLQILALAAVPVDPGILAAALGSECFATLEVLKRERLITDDDPQYRRAVFIPNRALGSVVRSGIDHKVEKDLRKRLIQALENAASSGSRYFGILAMLYDAEKIHERAFTYASQTAQTAEKVHDYGSALEYYRVVLKNTPERNRDHVMTALKIGELLTTTGQYKEALKLYQDLRDRATRPFHRKIIIGIGRTYYRMGDYVNAIAHLRMALTIQKKADGETTIDIQIRLAYCLSVTGAFKEAGQLLDRSMETARALGNAGLISAALYYRAVLEYQQGDYERSMQSATEHIRFSSENGVSRGSASPLLLISRIHQERNDPVMAQRHLDKALAILGKTSDINALLNAMECKAGLLFDQGEIIPSREQYERTLQKARQVNNEPVIISCLSSLSALDLMMGRFEPALQYAEEGTLLASQKIHFIITIVAIHIARGEIEKARMALDRAPDPSDRLYIRAALNLAVGKGDLKGAREHLAQLESNKPTEHPPQGANVTDHLDMMMHYYHLHDYPACANHARQIITCTALKDIRRTIARAYSKLADFHTKPGTLDISREIERLRQGSAVYEMIRLQRLSIQARMTMAMKDDFLRALSRELLDCMDTAQSIQAQQEISRLQELQHALFTRLIGKEMIRAAAGEYLATFSRIAELIEHRLGDDNFPRELLDIVIQATHAERGALFLNTPLNIEFVIGRDMDQTTIKDAAELSRTAIRDIHKKDIVYTHNALSDPDFNINKSVVLNKIHSILCIPLMVNDNVIGAIYLDSRFEGTMFSQQDRDFLLTVARILAAVIEKSRTIQRIINENTSLRASVITDIGEGYMVGTSRAMKTIYDLIDQVAETNAPVLFIGETGTGKGMLARLIHQRSKRRDRHFTVINCGTIPETLLESELFGHKKGAFTGAVADKPGLLEIAQGGTVFLDELTNTSPAFQAKLLEAIEDKVIRRVGDTRTCVIDVRFIFATNKDLEIEVEDGRFRKDLYYRINVFKIEIPPLRERVADIALLGRFFLERSGHEIGKKVLGFTPRAMASLRHYRWPGNVRELRHVVERAVVLAKGVNITHHDLNLDLRTGGAHGSIQEIKKEAVIEALEATNYNTSKAARLLGVNRRTIQRYRKTYHL